MMGLSQEERDKIYEEEKLRREIQKQIEQEEKSEQEQIVRKKLAEQELKNREVQIRESRTFWIFIGILLGLLLITMLWPIYLSVGISWCLYKIGKFTKKQAIVVGLLAWLPLAVIYNMSTNHMADVEKANADKQAQALKHQAEVVEAKRRKEQEQVPSSTRIARARTNIGKVSLESLDFDAQKKLLQSAKEEIAWIKATDPKYSIGEQLNKRIKTLSARIDSRAAYIAKIEAKKQEVAAKKRQEEEFRASAKLELLNSNWYESYDYAIYEGQIRNVSGESIRNVEAVVTFYDRNGNFITSDSALIEYNPILPGQASPFKVHATWNPSMETASVEFKEMFGGVLPTYRKQ